MVSGPLSSHFKVGQVVPTLIDDLKLLELMFAQLVSRLAVEMPSSECSGVFVEIL